MGCFTRDNDLYAIEIASGREVRYTADGSDVIKTGMPLGFITRRF